MGKRLTAQTEPRHYTTEAACSCEHWRFRPWARPCKHVAGLREAMELLDLQRNHNEGVKDGRLSALRSY